MSKDATPAAASADPATPSANAQSNAAAPPGGGAHDLQPLPLDTVSPQFTLRALLTGMVLAGVLSCCNIYTGLKVGWGFNMAITAALIAYGGWALAHSALGVRKFGLLENNINQTAAAAGGSVSSAGLVAPIPALAMLTGQKLDWYYLVLWVFSVCLVGITVAIGLRRQMILVDKLPFATGIATAETLRELYAKGREALKRVGMLVSAAVIAAPLQWLTQFKAPFMKAKLTSFFAFPVSFQGLSAKSLTFGLNSTLMMYGVGGLIGIRACTSMLIGAILAWVILAPQLIHSKYLRLEVAEPLAVLPAGVELLPEPQGYAKYDLNRNQLIWKGEMTPAERDALLTQSNDAMFREAVAKLYLRSQLELSAPLAALPKGVELPPDSPITYDAAKRVLVVHGGLDRVTYAKLRDQSDDLAFRAALDQLHALFAYSTTRYVESSEPLKTWPKGFLIPRAYLPLVHYDRAAGTIVATGRLPEDVAAALEQQARQYAEKQPAEKAACSAFIDALTRLAEHTSQPLLSPGTSLPGELGELFTYNPANQTLRAVGIPSAENFKSLRALAPKDNPGYADFQASVGALAAGTRFAPAEPDYRTVVTWLLWPGVTLMVVASLVSFGFSWRSILAAFVGRRPAADNTVTADTGEVSRTWFITALLAALVLSVILQVSFFAIVWWAAVVGILLTFVLAVVAGRVSGETNITPVGAMGKVTQLLFGVMTPGRVEPNLMAANVTGGAASQCAELLHDLKCGYLIGATPRLQVWAQICGALAGSLTGSIIYLVLIPNPQDQLITDEWAAPAVAAWKAVAELFAVGFQAIPAGTPVAMLIAGIAAIVLTVVEKTVPKKLRPYMLSPASLGLAFVIQAFTSMTMFVGAVVALLLGRYFKSWTARFLIAICAGIVAGESITGVGIALYKIDWAELLHLR